MRALCFLCKFRQLAKGIDKSCTMYKERLNYELSIILEFIVCKFSMLASNEIDSFACATNRARGTCCASVCVLASDRARPIEWPARVVTRIFGYKKQSHWVQFGCFLIFCQIQP